MSEESSLSGVNLLQYEKALTFLGYLSTLFTESSTPLIVPKAAERLFCLVSRSEDLATQDKSFDALMSNGIAVGIKTFGMNRNSSTKREKVAELTANATNGDFNGLGNEQLAFKVAELRNERVRSDANELGAESDQAFYHCLVRKPGLAIVHEEPYPIIDISKIEPLDKAGKRQATFEDLSHGSVYFSDGESDYTFSRAKNVLIKKFDLEKGFTSSPIPIRSLPNLWELVLQGKLVSLFEQFLEESQSPTDQDFLVLPLYSSRSGEKRVEAKSGINQWNAGGRKRSFAESYIPYPVKAKKDKPNFFPPRDEKFRLRLPNGKVISAKICQDGGKALMSDPNHELVDWLFPVIDGSISESLKRFDEKRPYTYSDLARIGKDSVKIVKDSSTAWDYKMEMATVGLYEKSIGEDDLEEI